MFVFAAVVSARAQGTEPPTAAPGDSVVYRSAVRFPKNEGKWIPQGEYKTVGRILRWAQANADVPIVITGWADESGTVAFNEKLSLHRARTVRNYLVSKGISPERITFEGCGIDRTATDEHQARRADVRGVIRLALVNEPEIQAKAEPVPVKKETENVVPPVEQETPQPEKQPAKEETTTPQVEQQPEQTAVVTQSSEPASSSGRYLAVKTNLAAWAGTIMNVAADVQVGKHVSVELPLLWCPWYVSDKHAVKTFTIQPEARYWLSRPGQGHFLGVHAHVGWYSVKWNRDRYQDTDRPLLGAGISYGYLLPFSPHWAGEFTLGAGYANTRYNTYYNIDNGARIDTRTKNYWGITRVGISVVYRFNLK